MVLEGVGPGRNLELITSMSPEVVHKCLLKGRPDRNSSAGFGPGGADLTPQQHLQPAVGGVDPPCRSSTWSYHQAGQAISLYPLDLQFYQKPKWVLCITSFVPGVGGQTPPAAAASAQPGGGRPGTAATTFAQGVDPPPEDIRVVRGT